VLVLWLLPVAPLWAEADGAAGIRIGVFPRRPAADTRRMFQPLAAYLSERLGLAVTLETPADYPAFWGAVEDGRYDLVHYNQYHYVRARKQLGHVLVAKNEEFGEARLRAAILVRDDSPFRIVQDLKGHKILFGGGPDAMVSYILATDILRDAGLRAGDYVEQFAQNPVKAVIALHYMQADAAAAGERVSALPLVTATIGRDRLRLLGYSLSVPHLPWAVSAGVDAAQRQAIRDALLALNRSARGPRILASMQLSGLVGASDSEYEVVRDVIRRVLGEDY
jgi:phosphonate transport system substrate-binding protein